MTQIAVFTSTALTANKEVTPVAVADTSKDEAIAELQAQLKALTDAFSASQTASTETTKTKAKASTAKTVDTSTDATAESTDATAKAE